MVKTAQNGDRPGLRRRFFSTYLRHPICRKGGHGAARGISSVACLRCLKGDGGMLDGLGRLSPSPSASPAAVFWAGAVRTTITRYCCWRRRRLPLFYR